MPRKKRQLDRDSGVLRDATLVVIASEDKYAVENYFRRFRTTRVQFRVLPTLDSKSNPESVLRRIDEFRQKEEVEPDDLFWLCIDRDHWTEKSHIDSLVRVLQECRQKGYHIAINNPCIELWFLLHFANYEQPTSSDSGRCKDVISQLERATGQNYSKHKCDRIIVNATQVFEALKRAKSMDVSDDVIPDSPSARIYKIVEMLQERDSIDMRS